MPTNFTLGTDLSPFGASAQTKPPLVPANQSADVIGAVQANVLGANVSQMPSFPGFLAGLFINRQPVAVVHSAATSGYKAEMFGGQLFEKVIVIPRSKALGF